MRKFLFLFVAALVLAATGLAGAAVAAPAVPTNETSVEEKAAPPQPVELDEKALWTRSLSCDLNHSAEVQGYRIVCTNATFLDARVADCCIPNDYWQVKVRSYDAQLTSAVTTAPGGAGAFGVAGRVYNQGGTPENPGGLRAYAECTYPHGGVNIFPASSTINFSSDGNCTVVADPVRARIDRSP